MSRAKAKYLRNQADFYPTPWEAFAPILPFLDKDSFHWEPACGDGRLLEWMGGVGINCGGQDLLVHNYDFLLDFETYDAHITNPPFSIAQQFINHARMTAIHEVWMLLRLNFLGAQDRKEWWQKNEPNALFVLSERPSFDEIEGGTDATEYAWFYWGKRHHGIFHP